jgi:hypothetical protein
MAKYPISHNGKKKLGVFFKEILMFHIPPSKDRVILDPTCGKKYLWEEFFKANLLNESESKGYGQIVFSDIKDHGQSIISDVRNLSFDYKFDGIIYDPPYFFGYKNSNDPRRADYGEYTQSLDDLVALMDVGNTKFVNLLKDNGKLIVKCADQYNTKERKFYPHHHTWINRLSNFQIIDLFVFIHHRISPTAFQVKNRPCSVIMHTYFLVFTKKSQECAV